MAIDTFIVYAGMSRGDLKDLGEQLDAGQAGLVVVAVSDMGSRVDAVMRKAQKVQAKELKVNPDDLEQDARQATDNADGSP